jgi:hypothetical protein
MFNDILSTKEYNSVQYDPNHELFSPNWDATYLCFFFLIISIYQYLESVTISKLIEKYLPCFKVWEDKLNTDENLG